MAGFQVSKPLLDQKVAEMVLAFRDAYRRVEGVQGFLVAHPVLDEPVESDDPEEEPTTKPVDPLTREPFGYTEDEAYLLRLTAGDFDYNREQMATTMKRARAFTGLE